MGLIHETFANTDLPESFGFDAPFTRGMEKVLISFVPTNILKYEHCHESEHFLRTTLRTIYTTFCSAHVSSMRPFGYKLVAKVTV